MKKLLLSVLTCLAFTVRIAARNGFAIVIDSVSYQEARPEVDAYARAIERLHGLKVYTVIDRWQVPDSIRAPETFARTEIRTYRRDCFRGRHPHRHGSRRTAPDQCL